MKNQDYIATMKQIQSLIDKREWQAAWEKLCMADSRFPNTPAILTAMGDCQIHLEKPEGAVARFIRVTELEPESVEAYNNLGVAYMFSGDFHQAEIAYLQALQFKPNHEQTVKNLAFLYFQQQDRLGDAATLLAGIVRSNPSDCEALYLMGKCYEMGGDLASAKLCFERILMYQSDSQMAIDALNQLQSVN
ncbi:tetratricopeptide repeat protein [Leptolinea tardivitalis]|uniref:Uncharacterized protein n=1 Tax=Leptolinea tardivitalis TaxID=229920 RepID=A0A0P6XIT6_9CHLR|nr:tetratricopeptide repeat protein [Leptolinea tardivitalis]KPL71087.1 hypothetical protein ADM99_12475 [Leptolinea tardivitalis]GAP22506.1 protein containing TPR repeat [Leptolinea tardivitalis]